MWKGRGPLLADVLRLYLSHYGTRRGDGGGSPVDAVLDLACNRLPRVRLGAGSCALCRAHAEPGRPNMRETVAASEGCPVSC